MARKSLLSFVFDADGGGCNIHIAGLDRVLRVSYGRLGTAIRNDLFNHGVKAKLGDVVAGDLKAGATPEMMAAEIERRIHALYNGQFNLRAAGQMFGDMVEAAVRLRPTADRAELERQLLGMTHAARELWARKPQVAPVIAQVVADRLATVAETAEPIGDDLFDI